MAAWELKERLLMYQRERTRRTQVYDDHADHYSATASRWLSRGEQEVAARRQQDELDKMQKHPAMQLNIGL